jgi:GGDEF domain-containing protein
MMFRESLTGLLKHTTTTEQLIIRLSQILHGKILLVFALIDLDNFKSLNDIYGPRSATKYSS